MSRTILVTICAAIFLVQVVYGDGTGTGFDYSEGPHGPEHWGGICLTGTRQSPIDIVKSDIVAENSLEPLKTQYVPDDASITRNPTNLQLEVQADPKIPFGTLTLQKDQLLDNSGQRLDGVVFDPNTTYTLGKFHFHAPSEHTINGQSFPLEMHLVHSNTAGTKTVIGILFKEGAENEFLAEFWNFLPNLTTTPNTTIDLSKLPLGSSYARYEGSLTTPNCSETVHWIVLLNDKITMSTAQIAAYKKYFPNANNRPIQPLNGRKVVMYGTFPSNFVDSSSSSSARTSKAASSFWIGLLLSGLIYNSIKSLFTL
ncbi:hypothetical protein R1flu_027130 [Riccia fluitans]|uniref:Carbonic anhydrase n=1 Tax=Riccia fluitans TaxID=41844 RepID=A0ABD1XHX0_9MARC